LADLVAEELLKLSEAMRALDSRIEETELLQKAATRVLLSVFDALSLTSST
jgi:hypothetical protein